MRIAVIGSGIAGLGSAWLLSRDHEVTLFEAEPRTGGHSNTVVVETDGRRIPVDTGFIVYNEATYPNLIALFAALGVPTKQSDMSFSVSVGGGRLEYEGSLRGLVAQPANLLKPSYWRMLADTARFFAAAPRLLAEAEGPTLGEFLAREGYSDEFIHDHLLPMAAAIWSCPVETMLAFPAKSFVRFCDNHGLLKHAGRPQWFTVDGGSREYVRRIEHDIRQRGGEIATGRPIAAVRRQAGGAMLAGPDGGETFFDQVVIATHGDQALSILADASPEERTVLSAFSYQRNDAVLHSDAALMPKRKAAWASWNYLAEGRRDMTRQVAVTYWMNRLQGIDPACPLFVTLNPLAEPDPATVHARFAYDHPVFDAAAVAMQERLPEIQGVRNTWFCGSYCGYGFHEDGLKAGIAIARSLGIDPPWATEVAPAALAPILGRGQTGVTLAAGE